MSMERGYQVVIVGGGPVGVALAVELGQRGVTCALVERHVVPQRIPKGQSLSNRTLEHFVSWRCMDELRAARLLPPGYPIGGVTAYGNLMSEFYFLQRDPPTRTPDRSFYFQANERLPQYLTEEVLRRRIAELPSVSTFFGWTATAFEHDDQGVRVTIAREGEATDQQVLEAEYLVGCDGARSLVRETLGIASQGANFEQKMVLAVFRSKELHQGLERFPERTTYRVLEPELHGYWQFFGRVDVGEGWFFHAPVPNDTTPESYDFLGLLQKAAGFSFAAEFDHVGFWDLRILVADHYQEGRVFIAGDACHSHPPYGGFGLNSGLEDVRNLGWKLGAVLQGWGGQRLLDSYTEERQPIFVETGEAIAAGIQRDDAFMQRYSPAKDRAEFERAWQEHGASGGARPQSYEPHYEGSSIVCGPPGAICSIRGSHTFEARPGHHLAPIPLSSGKNVFEAPGAGLTLLALDAPAGAVSGFEDAARQLRVPLTVVRDDRQERRGDYGSSLILVRPDEYVVWTADTAPANPKAILTRVIGR
jgi:2-polyprenyl-6-methoxyphenol hydroxylase-like FAD-dependent oxidoreductase